MAPTLQKRPSPIHDEGLYTTQAIDAGEVLYVVPMNRISLAPNSHYAKIGEKRWVDDAAVLNWVNHSCNPSVELVLTDNEPPKLRALRNISPDEEITVDYNKTETGGTETPCTCGDKNCRGYFLRVE